MKLKFILYMLIVLPFLGSCNNEDDVEEIFASGTWYVVNYYGKANWDKRNGEPKYKATDKEGRAALEVISKFTLVFKTDGSLEGSMQNGSFKGTWQADGKDRTIRLDIEGNPNTSNYNGEYINALRNAAFYQGDSNFIMLGPEDKKTYIQFKHN